MDMEDDTDAVKLRGLLESTGLKQHVTVPTHISGHILDLGTTRLSTSLVFPPHGPIIYFLTTCQSTPSSKCANLPLKDRI